MDARETYTLCGLLVYVAAVPAFVLALTAPVTALAFLLGAVTAVVVNRALGLVCAVRTRDVSGGTQCSNSASVTRTSSVSSTSRRSYSGRPPPVRATNIGSTSCGGSLSAPSLAGDSSP